MSSLRLVLVSATRQASRPLDARIGGDRGDPDRRQFQFFIEPRAFAQQSPPHGLDVIHQSDQLRPPFRAGAVGADLQSPQPAKQGLAFAKSIVLSTGHGYLLTAEISVSNILLTVVITCEAAE